LKEISERAQIEKRGRQQREGNALTPAGQMKRKGNTPLLTPAQRKALRQQQQKSKP